VPIEPIPRQLKQQVDDASSQARSAAEGEASPTSDERRTLEEASGDIAGEARSERR